MNDQDRIKYNLKAHGKLWKRCLAAEKENDRYVVWSHEHSAWWRPNSAGYCRDVREAGIYSREEALSISHRGRDGWRPEDMPDELPVRVSDLPEFARAALKDTSS